MDRGRSPGRGGCSCVPPNSSARNVIGRWQVECEGGKETLELRPDGGENADMFKDVSVADNTLEPVWEWGHTELSFNPDFGGFRRIASSQ